MYLLICIYCISYMDILLANFSRTYHRKSVMVPSPALHRATHDSIENVVYRVRHSAFWLENDHYQNSHTTT